MRSTVFELGLTPGGTSTFADRQLRHELHERDAPNLKKNYLRENSSTQLCFASAIAHLDQPTYRQPAWALAAGSYEAESSSGSSSNLRERLFVDGLARGEQIERAIESLTRAR